MDFAVPADYRVKLKNWKKTEKTVEHESDDYTNCNWCSWYSQQRIGTRTGGLGNNETGGDWSNSTIIEIGKNTEKSPGDLRTLAITETPVKDHHSFRWCEKLSKSKIIIIIIIIRTKT